MRRPPVPLSFAIAWLLGCGPAGAAELRDLRLAQTETGTRAELRLDSVPEARIFTLANPDRLVIDLPETRAASGFRLPGGNGAVANLRTGQPTPGTLRVVFDLGMTVRMRHHLETAGNERRLVVELDSAPGQSMPTGVARSTAPSSPTAMPPLLMETRAVSPGKALAAVGSSLPPAASSSVAEELQDNGPTTISNLGGAGLSAVSPEQILNAQSVPSPTVVPAEAQASLVTYTAAPSLPAPSLPSTLPAAQATFAATPARAPTKTMLDVIGRGQRKLVVAIDAGHGGKDPGAHGPSGVREKQVTLEVARALARQINADPGMRAVLIRENDSFVPLQQRYMKARAAQADLFISIHADASPNDSANGASVFVLSTRGASSQAARWLADKENAADLVGGVSLDQKDPHLAAVLLDLSQSATMRASDDVANQVLGALKNVGKAHKSSIERANFVVLRSPDVPSMLVETGFITNPVEERRLNDPEYRGRLASAITEGVRRYFIGQPPPGSWYAVRAAGSGQIGGNAAQVASAPE